MTYDEFKTFLVSHLWKTGDQRVINNLNTIIQMADNELNATFKVFQRHLLATTDAVDNIVSLPVGFRSLRAVWSNSGAMKYISPDGFSQIMATLSDDVTKYYTATGNYLMLTGTINVDNPWPINIFYYSDIPNFEVTDASWLAEKYLNVYTYCILKHSAPFLREDERLITWGGLYQEAFNNAMEESKSELELAGTPLKLKMRGVR